MLSDNLSSTEAINISPKQKADLLKRVIELLAPDLKSFYPTTVKGRIEKVYTTDDKHFYCDVQPLNNDESVDETRAVINHVAMPILYAGPDRGIVCQPVVGLLCDITYYGGDENYPGISNLRYTNKKVPSGVRPGELLIQKGPGNYTKFRNDGSREEAIPGDAKKRVGRDKTETIAGGSVSYVGKDRVDETRGDQVVECSGRLSVNAGKGIDLNTTPLTVNAEGGIELNAAGSFNAGGATTNLVSEDSLTLLSAGPITQVADGAISQNAANLKQELTNVQTPPVENVYELDALLGHYKINLTAGDFDLNITAGNFDVDITTGNFEVDIASGVFNFSNTDKSLRAIVEDIYTRLDALMEQVLEMCKQIAAIVVPTGVGPSSTPTNSTQFDTTIWNAVDAIKSDAKDDKDNLGDFFTG